MTRVANSEWRMANTPKYLASLSTVMPGLVPGIHALLCDKEGVDGRDIGERSDAVLRPAMPGHDEL